MTKVSDFSALTGASVDAAADLVPVVDMSEAGSARNKKMTFTEMKVAIGAYTPGGTDVALADGGTGASTAAAARTNLGATTVGANVFTLTNPSAIRFLRLNADNTVDALDAATFRTAIGAGTGSGGGDLLAANNLSDLASAATARTNLGLGTAAVLSTADIDERARDALGAALVAGTNITITPDDGAETITISASGGGGSGFPNRAFYNTATNTNSTATIPFDGTIPQISEGEAVFDADLTITPTTITSRIRVEVNLQLGSIGAGGQWAIAALFLNGGANAVEAKAVFCTTGGASYSALLVYEWVPGSTSVQTLHTRYGPALAGTASLLPSNTTLGGVCKCSITAYEVA